MAKRVVIIGAGIGGLAAGCYARMNGYDAQILESHTTPGGLCTSWKRKGFTVDGSCHWVTGSGPASPYYTIWNEIGAIQDRTYIDYDYFVRFQDANGRVFSLYTDADRLEAHMKELSPQDAAPTEELCRMIREFSRFSMPIRKPPELMNLMDGLLLMRKFGPFRKLFALAGAFSAEGFSSRFKDPLLREAIHNALFGASPSLFPLIMTMGTMHARTAGYPLGGSLEFARAIERRYLSLGGTVRYGARVSKVVERDGKAVGVELSGGETVEADWVISACDMKWTLQGLLDGTRMDPVHRELLQTGVTIPPAIQVSFGVDMDLSDRETGFNQGFRLNQPLCIGGKTIEWYNYKAYSFDPSMAPKGKSTVVTIFLGDWKYWEKLKANPILYKEEKARIAQDCARAMDQRFPGFSSKVEMSDVATPLTFERYTGNWKGSYMTWILSPEFQRKHRYVPKTVPGLDRFSMASMWTNPPGGLPGAASAGRGVIQLLCARDRRRFVTSTP